MTPPKDETETRTETETETEAAKKKAAAEKETETVTETETEEEEEIEAEAEGKKFPWDEHNRLKREAAKTAKQKRADEKKRAEEEGRFQDVVKSVEEERDSEKDRADTAEGELAKMRRQAAVQAVASRLNFRDPADALLHLPDSTDASDEKAVERALAKVKKEKPYLIDGQGSRTSTSVNGADTPEPADLDAQIKEAEEAGDTRKSIALKNQKLLAQSK
jgi:hypothetical protein